MVPTLLNLIESRARQDGEGTVILGVGCDALSYDRLVVHIRQAATCLAGTGLKRNDRVAIVLPNGPEMAVSFLAVSTVATCAPLNPAYSAEEFEFYLGDLKAKAMIATSETAPNAIRAAQAQSIPVVMLAPLTEAGPSFLPAPEPGRDAFQRVRDIAGKEWDAVERVPTGSLLTEVEFAQPDDVALVLHTSGTTSRPKIVPLTHRNLVCSAQTIARSLELTPQDRCLNIMPLFHVHGLLGALCSSLSAGGSVVCAPGFHAAEFLRWLERFEPTWFTAVPTMHQSILARAVSLGGGPSHRLRFIRSCSSALAPKLMTEMEQVFGVPVIEAYGMTEASHQMASNPLPPRKRKPGSVGIASGPEVAIMDDSGRLLPAGVTGEIVIRGESVTGGYEGNPEANRKAFTDSWFRTGDQGHLDAEGYLFLTGRIKEIINRGGEKISPREIDEVLLDHPAVAQAVAFAIPDPRLGEEVGAAIVLHDKASATEREIREFAATRLAHFKVPARVVFLREIPKGPTGKLQRVSLASTLGLTGQKPTPAPRPPFVAPGTRLEMTLAGIWEEVLGVGSVGRNDHFQHLGGDSLGCTRVASRIRQALQVEVSVAQVFAAPTLAEQAGMVEKVKSLQLSQPAVLARLLDEVEGLQPHQRLGQ